MGNLIEIARVRRMRYESTKTERELSAVDFDEFGNPIPLEKGDGCVTSSEAEEALLSALRPLTDEEER